MTAVTAEGESRRVRPGDDERLRATVDAIDDELTHLALIEGAARIILAERLEEM